METANTRTLGQHLLVFAALALLTLAAVALRYAPWPRPLVLAGLGVCALLQVAGLLLFTMEIGRGSRPFQLFVVSSLVLPIVYALALVADAVARRGGLT